jgi:hypothetical protein
MTTKSVSQQIIDEFIAELSKAKTIEQSRLDSMKDLLNSGKFKKDDIAKLLKEEKENENP